MYHAPVVSHRCLALGRSCLLGGTLVQGLACAAPSQPAAVRFPPGELAVTRGDVELELHSAEYDEQAVRIALTIRNAASVPLEVERDGILLAYKQLEFPVDAEDPAAPSSTVTVPAKGAAKLEVAFTTGSAIRQPAALRLRALRRSDRWLDGVRLAVPPVPVSTEPSR